VAVGVSVGVAVGVSVGVTVGVAVDVAVDVAVGLAVGVGVDVAVCPPPPPPISTGRKAWGVRGPCACGADAAAKAVPAATTIAAAKAASRIRVPGWLDIFSSLASPVAETDRSQRYSSLNVALAHCCSKTYAERRRLRSS
jgi:hypothetical protein